MNLPSSKKSFLYIFLFLSFFFSFRLSAFQSKEIEELAQQYLVEHEGQYKTYPEQRVEFIISNLDNRLSLKPCRSKPIVQPQDSLYSTTRFTLRIMCQEEQTWLQYVSVQVKVMGYVVISKMPISKQTLIDADMLELKEMNVSGMTKAYFRDITEVTGKVAKTSIGPNQIISDNHLEFPIAIQKNQTVTIVAKTGKVEVKMSGTAIENGRIGQRIKVKNTKSGRIIEATVLDSNTVVTH